MTEVTMLLVKHFGVISTSKRGWTKELNLVSWNGREPKYDIREWSEDRKKSSKGLTFSKDEMIELKKVMNDIVFDDNSEE